MLVPKAKGGRVACLRFPRGRRVAVILTAGLLITLAACVRPGCGGTPPRSSRRLVVAEVYAAALKKMRAYARESSVASAEISGLCVVVQRTKTLTEKSFDEVVEVFPGVPELRGPNEWWGTWGSALEVEGVTRSHWGAFATANAYAHDLVEWIPPSPRVELVPGGDLPGFGLEWAARFPHAAEAYFVLSSVGLSTDGNMALLYVEMGGPDVTDQGLYWVFRRGESGWQVASVILAWIS